MIFFTELDLWVSKELQPLRSYLGQAGIPLAMLPKEAASFTSESHAMVSVAISQVLGQEPPPNFQTQQITYEFAIALRFPRRYKGHPIDRRDLESCVESILRALIGKKPPLPKVTVAIWLNSYQLLQPEGRQWLASLVLRFSRLASPDDSLTPSAIADELAAELYATNSNNNNEVLEVEFK
ncbi:MAG: hypothetical protein F6K65_22125 [Moorea sp. SIO3C2]|nr:hypothetical protein [Moorena sp. SIO3C2]